MRLEQTSHSRLEELGIQRPTPRESQSRRPLVESRQQGSHLLSSEIVSQGHAALSPRGTRGLDGGAVDL